MAFRVAATARVGPRGETGGSTSQFALLLREQEHLQAKKLASRSSDVVHECRSYAEILAEHSRGAAVEATQRTASCVKALL